MRRLDREGSGSGHSTRRSSEAIVQVENALADLIEQTGRLKWRITGFHGKFAPVYLVPDREAPSPLGEPTEMSREDFQNLLDLAQAVPFFDISASF